MVRAHVFISGLVQGVFFRMYSQREAQALGLSGWVRNLAEAPSFAKASEGPGVEAVFEGEKQAVNEMISWCWSGSPSAQVNNVEVEWGDPEGLAKFEIRR